MKRFSLVLRNFNKIFQSIEQGRIKPKVVHQLRVSSRRIESFFKAHSEMLKRDENARELHEFSRKMRKALGEIRDIDVHKRLIKKSISKEFLSPWLRRQFKKNRKKEVAKFFRKISLKSKKNWISDFQLENWDNDRKTNRKNPLCGILQISQVLVLHEQFDQEKDIARLHQFRILLKKIRYSLEYMQEFEPSKLRKHLSSLKRQQDALGAIHDLETLSEYLSNLGNKSKKKKLKAEAKRIESILAQLAEQKKIRIQNWTNHWPQQKLFWNSLQESLRSLKAPA